MNRPDVHEPAGGIGINEVLGIAWRRRTLIAVPAVLGTIAAVIAGTVMPKVYRASSTLLIESPEIPATLVASPFNSLADERIAKIRQQILSRDNLLRLVAKEGLYPEERAKQPIDQILSGMHDAISVDLVSASAGNASGTAKGGDPTIAFSLSFRYGEPQRAYRVASTLTGMFIHADKMLRTAQASGAVSFLKTRADELRDRLVELENRRRDIQSRYAGALPEQATLAMQAGSALRSEVSRIDSEIQAINQQNVLLAGRSQEMQAIEAPGHAEVRRAEQALARLRATLSDSHPDVIAAREALELARQAERDEPPAHNFAGSLAAEINGGRNRIAVLSQRRAQLLAAIATGERQLSLSPQAAYEMHNLDSDVEGLRTQYAATREKQLEAQVAANLQIEDKGERFKVVDPPTMPTEPISPQPLKLLLIGAQGGLGLGLVLALALELMSGWINGARAIARLTGEAPLTTIPNMKSGPSLGLRRGLERFMPWRLRRAAG
ncbi:lipopolysaccharide biosynthesis protein [Sphingosinicellaceae bacterium]|nr:lipopolysaccharide biosynthesis protein [Sphingosinicellaceae bacterium]